MSFSPPFGSSGLFGLNPTLISAVEIVRSVREKSGPAYFAFARLTRFHSGDEDAWPVCHAAGSSRKSNSEGVGISKVTMTTSWGIVHEF